MACLLMPYRLNIKLWAMVDDMAAIDAGDQMGVCSGDRMWTLGCLDSDNVSGLRDLSQMLMPELCKISGVDKG